MPSSYYNASLCVTHLCNLSCRYCYQHHDGENRMDYSTAIHAVDWIINNTPKDKSGILLSFIGGEPLLEFDLIKDVFSYCQRAHTDIPIRFFASTNGTLLNDAMKRWFYDRKERFVLGLSLDGTPAVHDYNRSNSYNLIDIPFFLKTWPIQGAKMTLSEYSLPNLADCIIHLHELGFKKIDGANLAEGTIDWGKDEHIRTLVPQLKRLSEYYVKNDDVQLAQIFNKRLDMCVRPSNTPRKWCGIGSNMVFFDTDGSRFPCAFVTPMTFSRAELEHIQQYDFCNDAAFLDEECQKTCFLFPVCSTCAGANYLATGTFHLRDKSKCKINRLLALFSADIIGKRIIKNADTLSNNRHIYETIEAIKTIKELYYPEFAELIENGS